MKRGSVLLMGILGVISMLFSGCSGFLGLESNENKVDAIFDQLLYAIEAKDEKTIEELFAKNVISEENNFDQSVEKLLSFCNGEVVSYDIRPSRITAEDRKWSEHTMDISSAYDVKTTEGQYRFAMKYRSADSKEPRNVGIVSLYVTECENEEYLKFAYWGDGNWTPGIVIEPKEISGERFSARLSKG